MERTKFNGIIYNSNKYPHGYMVPGGHLAYPSKQCCMPQCIKNDRGIPVIDFGCCTSICEKKCYRYEQWRQHNFAERKAILADFIEWQNGR